jgi:glycine/D-amino acid oxidase-like deaminating enzyme
VVIVGAGAIGAACAFFLSGRGLRVHVVERAQVAAGTTSACEGNVLVSDKAPGPELDLALYSQTVWRTDLAEHQHLWEFESKGGLVDAATDAERQALRALGEGQRRHGVVVEEVAADAIPDHEPHLRRGLAAAARYPQDAQVHPILLAAHLLRLARLRGATLSTGVEVTGLLRSPDGRVHGVRTSHGTVSSAYVVNAAGTAATRIAAMAGVAVPVLPRRGFVLVTEPLPPMIRHKVYAAAYVASTLSSDEALQTSTVIEGTPAGSILIGSSRERIGFDSRVSLDVIRALSADALALFPGLADVRVLRSYLGFRPYCPDHLPAIGLDPRAPGLAHAAGHEGAGIGLSVGTAKLLAQQVAGVPTDLGLESYSPGRFTQDVHR